MISQIGASDAFLADDFREGTCKLYINDGTGHELGLSDRNIRLSDRNIRRE